MNRREALRTLAAGSAAGTLAGGLVTLAIPAAEAAADPCLAFVTEWRTVRDLSNASPSDAFYEARVRPLEDLAAFGTIPAATTMRGVLSALQMVIRIAEDEGEYASLEAQDANLIRAALAYLEGVVS